MFPSQAITPGMIGPERPLGPTIPLPRVVKGRPGLYYGRTVIDPLCSTVVWLPVGPRYDRDAEAPMLCVTVNLPDCMHGS